MAGEHARFANEHGKAEYDRVRDQADTEYERERRQWEMETEQNRW
jgi:hypothetical protein